MRSGQKKSEVFIKYEAEVSSRVSGGERGVVDFDVAIFVRSHLASTVKLIKAASRYIMIQVDQTVFVNVFLPCVSSPGREQDIIDCLADIMNVLDTLNFVNIVFGGDLNVDFVTANHFCGVLLSFADDLGLRFVFDKVPLDARKTFRVEATGASSRIDHFAVSQALACILIMSRIDYCNAVLHGAPSSRSCSEYRTTQLGSFSKHQDDPTLARC